MAKARTVEWKEYEELAYSIFQELMPHAAVTYDDHLSGHQTEGPRQIDVSARWTDEQGVSHLLIIQVKDLKSRANVITVGEFRSVIEDVQADRGVLICSGGFSDRAKRYARNIGMSLFSLHDAQSTKWNRELTVPGHLASGDTQR